MSPGSSPAERPVSDREEAGSVPARGSTYHYVILRREMNGGAMLAQAVHAAGESASQHTAETGLELPDTTRAVVLGATRDELAALRFDLEEAEVPHRVVVETEGNLSGVLAAIGLVTVDREQLKRDVPLLAQLRPWRA